MNLFNSNVIIEDDMLDKWQKIVDLMAKMSNVPAGLIMRIKDDELEVFVSSISDGNPYKVGESENYIGSGLYCETVLNTSGKLLIPNALEDENWKDNPDVKLNMISYLGFPIYKPDGNAFGTICILDNKKNSYNQDTEDLMKELKSLIEHEMKISNQNIEIKKLNDDLLESIDEIKQLKEFIPICSFCRKVRDDEGFWEQVESYITKTTGALFSHSVCPDCRVEHYPKLKK